MRARGRLTNRQDAARARAALTPGEGCDLELGQLRRLEIASFAEGTTLLLLVGVAVPLKHLGGWGTGVRIMGPIHGLTFMTYLWLWVQTVAGGGWNRGKTVRLFIAAIVPFGRFFNLPFLTRKMANLRAGGSTGESC